MTVSGTGVSGVKRIVPFDSEKPARSSATAATTSGLKGCIEQWSFLAVNPKQGLAGDT